MHLIHCIDDLPLLLLIILLDERHSLKVENGVQFQRHSRSPHDGTVKDKEGSFVLVVVHYYDNCQGG